MLKKVKVLEDSKLEKFLNRVRKGLLPEPYPFSDLIKTIIVNIVNFIPLDRGRLMFDDPNLKLKPSQENYLYVAAIYGDSDEEGGLNSEVNIREDPVRCRVYLQGELVKEMMGDMYYLGLPIFVEKTICGGLELYRRISKGEFSQREVELATFFANYISSSFQNAVDNFKMRKVAFMDRLTGLYNLYYLEQVLTNYIKEIEKGEAHEIVLLFLDMDRFKEVNDTYGHLVGSSVLHHIGKVLKRTIKERGLCFRYGGDEFIVLFKDITLNEAIEIAEKIKKEISLLSDIIPNLFENETKVEEGKVKLNLSCSIGISTYTKDISPSLPLKEKTKRLIIAADNYMYIAKERGKGKIVYSSLG